LFLAAVGWIAWQLGQLRGGPGRADHPGELHRINGHADIVYGVAFAPDGRRGVSCGKDRTVRVWDLETGTLEARLEGFPGTVNSVAWSPTDDLILLGAQRPSKEACYARLWDVDPGKPIRQFPLAGHTTAVLAVAFSPDGKWALTGGGQREHGDLALRLWNVAERREVGRLPGHEDFIWRVVFSPTGAQAASCGNDGTVRLWDVDKRAEAHCFRDLGGRALSLAFAPDGRRLAAGGEDRRIRVWDVEARRETAVLDGHAGEVFGVAFLPDGRRLVSASADMTLRVWDLAGRRETHRFEGHTDIITNLAVSPDGTRALTCSQDRTVRLWELPR
jgi:WD40 repeat protein